MTHQATAMFTCSVLTLLSGTALPAQGAIVVPEAATQYSTLDYNFQALPSTRDPVMRTQYIYDVSSIPVATATLKSLQIRPVAQIPLGPYLTNGNFVDMTVTMSMSPVRHDAASATFAANHGPNPVQVFQGKAGLSSVYYLKSWPAPWQNPLVFQTPFAFDRSAGASLVVEIVASNLAQNTFWGVEEYRQDIGALKLAWKDYNCRTADGRSPGLEYAPEKFVVGGMVWQVHCCFANKTSYASSVVLFGDGSPGATYGGLPLPVSLNGLGLPAMPACRLAVAPWAAIAPQYVPGSGAYPTSFRLGPFPIPNDPALVHVEYDTQLMVLDTDSSGAPLVFSQASYWWRIGSDRPLPIAKLYAPGATTATGTLVPSRAISLRLNY